MIKRKLAIVTTHPIQYYAPVFRLLTERQNIRIKVFYTWGEGSLKKFDPGFGKEIEWDIPLLEGYDHEFLENTAKDPGTHHFNGIINPAAIERIEDYRPDALLVYGWSNKSHLKVLRYFKNKKPIYFRGDSNLVDNRKDIKSFLRNLFLKWLYRHIDFAFYVGKANKAYYLKAGVNEDHLLFAAHATDNSRFAENRKEEAMNLRANLNIAEDETLILFAGKLEEKKHPALLLQAFKKLKKPGLHLLFTGSGIMENTLKEMAKGNGNIHFMEFQNQSRLPVIYQACDLFCLPSKGPGETWGLAVNEAMAAGKAVIVSDKVGCAADLVIDNVNGKVFGSDDENSLISALNDLTGSKDRLNNMGYASREVIKDWTFGHQVMNIEKALLKS